MGITWGDNKGTVIKSSPVNFGQQVYKCTAQNMQIIYYALFIQQSSAPSRAIHVRRKSKKLIK